MCRRCSLEKVLFWDFDGTLVLPDSKWSDALHTSLTEYNYDISMAEIRNHLHSGYTWHTPEIAYLENAGQKWWKKLFLHFNLLYKQHNIPDSLAEEINGYLKSRVLDCRNYTLYNDASAALQTCMEKGYKNYILSNNFPELPDVIKGLNLSEYFIDYVVSANIGYEKPRQEIFQYALETADFPNVCYMIGDNPIADIQGGKSAGMKTVLVHRSGTYDADFMCENLSEIPLILH